MAKRTNKDLQNITQKIKDRATQTQQKAGLPPVGILDLWLLITPLVS
jgi:hypothetical protein